MRWGLALAWALAASTSAACRTPASSDPPDPSASPQAKAEPAPIASSPPELGPPGGSANAPFAPPPTPLRPDEPVPLEPPPKDPVHETAARETTKDPPPPPIYELTLAIHSSDVAPPPKGVELSAVGLEAARRKTEPSLSVDLAPGHARAVLHEGFVLPEGTELRVRADRLGYVVLAPDGGSYRVGAVGSLRAVLGEGLFDVAPSSAADVVARGDGAHRLGRATRRVEVTTRAAKASFELAKIPDVTDGGGLLCRLFLELMSARAGTQVCGDGEVPLRVELHWNGQPAQPPQTTGPPGRPRSSGVATFDALALERKVDLAAGSLLTPPPTARFVASGDPMRGSHLFLTRADLAAMHAGVGEGAHPGDATAVLSLHNSTDELRFVWLDGVSLAWLAPGGRLDVSGVPHAHVSVQWRTFLGDAIDQAEVVTMPATVDALSGARGAVSASDNPPP